MCDVEDDGLHQTTHNEKNILQNLDCTFINRFVYFYDDSILNKTFLVLEHAGHKKLSEFTTETRALSTPPQALDENLVRSIMTQLFEATNYLHQNRVCHRDLRPDNILITQDSTSKHYMSIKVTLIGFNASVKLDGENSMIYGGEGLKEWSAPETRL